MFDKALALEILDQISNSIEIVNIRFEPIKTYEDFLSSPNGMEKLDSICMQLIVIGESLKNLDKVTKMKLLVNYPNIEWKKIKGLRDIITHHYMDINAEAIFDVCMNKLPELLTTIKDISKNLKS